jgi:hypothetical protein
MVLEQTSLSHNSVYGFKYFSPRNSVILVILLLFHNSSHKISIAEIIYRMHVVCKSVKYFDYPTVLQHNTSTWSKILGKALYKQELDQVTAMLTCFTSE